MGVNTDIQTALDTRLSTQFTNIAWPNVEYAPILGTAYIRPTLLPARTVTGELDTTYLHKGIYQIDIYVPSNNGESDLYNLLDEITSLYKSNLTLVSNTTIVYIQTISRGKAHRDGAWYSSFIEINYFSYAL